MHKYYILNQIYCIYGPSPGSVLILCNAMYIGGVRSETVPVLFISLCPSEYYIPAE